MFLDQAFVHRPCLFPLIGYFDSDRRFKMGTEGYNQSFEPAVLSCGRCFNCLLNKRMDWTVRLFHESLYWEHTYFVTLTYSDEFLGDNVLSKDVMQKFLKRLRKNFKCDIKYFLCGEYGSKSGRAHYHLLLYTSELLPLTFLKRQRQHDYFVSDIISKSWKFGFNIVSDLNLSTIRYVCGYVLKKLGKPSDVTKPPEFILCSRKPGIGLRYIQEHWLTAINNGFCTIQGQKYSLPRYYLDYVKLTYPEYYATIKPERQPELINGVATVGCQRAVKRKHALYSGGSFESKI